MMSLTETSNNDSPHINSHVSIATNLNLFAAKYLCPSCRHAVLTGNNVPDSLGCDGHCKRWYHRECVGLNLVDYRDIQHEQPWKCNDCRRQETAVDELIASVQTPTLPLAAPNTDIYPPFCPAKNQENIPPSALKWGTLKTYDEIHNSLTAAYEEIVKWKKKYFQDSVWPCRKIRCRGDV